MTPRKEHLVIRGGRYAIGPHEAEIASVRITGDHISRIMSLRSALPDAASTSTEVDLSGFLLLPGFVNAHDHLEFSLFPRLGNPPHRNYIDWGEDIHRRFPEVIAKYRAVSKEDRLWWGAIRNLLSGVTTVCHHNPLWPELLREEFPVRVVSEYGWGHSLALGSDLRQARSTTPEGRPFIVHACEGIDEPAREELRGLDRLGLLDNFTVLVHGLAVDQEGVSLICERGTSLIVCPSSNNFLFGVLPNISLLSRIKDLSLGSDSPLTAEGDLLDEVRFAIRFLGISPGAAYQMVTTAPAAILRLREAEGCIREFGRADLIAVQDTGQGPAERLKTLSARDVALVMIGGRVQLATEAILKRLPLSVREGMERLSINGSIRWVRAPVKRLLRKAEEILGEGKVRLGSRQVSVPAGLEVEHAC